MPERIAEISGPLATEVVSRARAAGFDTLLLGDLETDGLARLATAGDLACWLLVVPDAVGNPRFTIRASPPIAPWLRQGDAMLDPRRAPRTVRRDPVADPEAVLAAWRDRIGAAIAAGARGFVCREPDRFPAAFWSGLIDGFARAGQSPRWVAWTAGLAPADIDRLVAAGFDTVTSSVAWWDGRSHWLADEAACAPQARKLGFPFDPFEAPDDFALPIEQRVRLAAVTSDALFVPEAVWTQHDCSALNHWLASGGDRSPGAIRFITGPGAPVTALHRSSSSDLRTSERVVLVLLNPDGRRDACIAGAAVTTQLGGFGHYKEVLPIVDDPDPVAPIIDPCAMLRLGPGRMRAFEAERLPLQRRRVATTRRSAIAACEKPRLAIEAVTPTVDGGRFPAKRIVGEILRVEADILIDGHEKLAAVLLFRPLDAKTWREVPMTPLVNDRFVARFPLERIGRHEFTIEAWRDAFATYRNELDKKYAAGLDVSLELIEGRRLVEAALAHAKTLKRAELARRLTTLSRAVAVDVAGDRAAMADQAGALLASQTLADMREADSRPFATRPDAPFPVDVERSHAGFASWYELFPRSLGNPPGVEPVHHGTFDDVIERLPAVRAMGFDVLYFPPIHPIGLRNRKGRNNSLTAREDDPGSPYAIGSADGGHDALHPSLGTFEDFRRLRDAAFEQGLELALDFAIQCSPDHPWLRDHPGWFAWRPDGSLRYAENPPKKYEDIVNVDFYNSDSAPALWSALRDVVLLWVEQGVRIFRVDNPHTKPLPFWEWMIGEVRTRHPDTLFLSEAFTRPKVMYRLAKVGFSQSYTYFTWRHTKQEFIDYLTELTGPRSSETLGSPPREFFRPNFFVNTPDINPVFLQRSGRPGFLIRAALAATLSGVWGVYSGFELCEAVPVPDKEDYLDSEKYQLRAWDWQRPGNIIREITALNRIRNDNPALRTHLNIRFQTVFDPNILYFSKATDDGSNILLIAINLDPFGVHEADFEVPLWEWGRADDAVVDATDLLDGHRFRWHGKVQRMRLDPRVNPYAIWQVTP